MKKMLIVALAVGMTSTANATFWLDSTEGDTLDPTGVIAPNVTNISILIDVAYRRPGASMILTIPAGSPGSWTGTGYLFNPPVVGGMNTYYGVVDPGIGLVDLWYCNLSHIDWYADIYCAPCCCANYEFVCTGVGDVTITLWRDDLVTVIDTITIHQVSEPVDDPPAADLNGDCFVDFRDLALIAIDWPVADFDDVAAIANHWLATDPCLPDDIVYIPGGTFEMGDHHENHSYETPVHTITLDSFYMGNHEITNRQYCDYLNSAYDACDIKVDDGIVYAFSDSNSFPYCDTNSADADSQIDFSGGVFTVRTKSARDMSNYPMGEVTWRGAAAYCNWRSQEAGYQRCYDPCDPNWACDFSKKGYRLPTEAEWEYAARGKLSGSRFPWGDLISHSYANYYSLWEEGNPYYSYDSSPTEGYHPAWDDAGYPYTSPVGSFSANGYGLYDMAGNVYEWCNDWYDENYYEYSPADNPTGPTSGTYSILRGGSWQSYTNFCRTAARACIVPWASNHNFGFRLVLDLN